MNLLDRFRHRTSMRVALGVLLVAIALGPVAADVCAIECAQTMALPGTATSSAAPACHEHASAGPDVRVVRSTPPCASVTMLTPPAVQTAANRTDIAGIALIAACAPGAVDARVQPMAMSSDPPPISPAARTRLALRI